MNAYTGNLSVVTSAPGGPQSGAIKASFLFWHTLGFFFMALLVRDLILLPQLW
jgi:hypothetical protein